MRIDKYLGYSREEIRAKLLSDDWDPQLLVRYGHLIDMIAEKTKDSHSFYVYAKTLSTVAYEVSQELLQKEIDSP